MNTYKLTLPDSIVLYQDASDMRAALTVNDCVYQRAEPIKVELVTD